MNRLFGPTPYESMPQGSMLDHVPPPLGRAQPESVTGGKRERDATDGRAVLQNLTKLRKIDEELAASKSQEVTELERKLEEARRTSAENLNKLRQERTALVMKVPDGAVENVSVTYNTLNEGYLYLVRGDSGKYQVGVTMNERMGVERLEKLVQELTALLATLKNKT